MIDIKINTNQLNQEDVNKYFKAIEEYVENLKSNNIKIDKRFEKAYIEAIEILKQSFDNIININTKTNKFTKTFNTDFFNIFKNPSFMLDDIFDKTKKSFNKLKEELKEEDKVKSNDGIEIEKLKEENKRLKQALKAMLSE